MNYGYSKYGRVLLLRTLGESVDLDTIKTALTGLIGGKGGELDLAGLVQKMMGNDSMQGIVSPF